ncbi:chitin-binding protein [Pseudomonas migulae]|uniref:lytic polysaccharide monooxygenase auxiliary activity family 9 protein n=1 Tax=Pseudomonas migulae TaxID=78543 RepID=UPI0020A08C9C|nr:lytic polysaccharide monooxygenase auxiliary activity family 9 protein [Pseudomonas migulae]MCP1518311.1 chitin-binding protein [Pseudomonas migulae]
MSTSSPKTNSQNISPMHGHVPSPASRAYFAWKAGKLDVGALNQLESGKHFPATVGGLEDPFAPQDVPSAVPPKDDKIASAGHPAAAFLDKPGDDWEKHPVQSGDTLAVSWGFSARHSTRRWNYFLTKPDWNSALPLSRAQFEATPFHMVENKQQPYWDHREDMLPPDPTLHHLLLPTRVGYHVLLGVWEVAETGAAFYQVIDLLFGAGNRPDKPTGLIASNVTDA